MDSKVEGPGSPSVASGVPPKSESDAAPESFPVPGPFVPLNRPMSSRRPTRSPPVDARLDEKGQQDWYER